MQYSRARLVLVGYLLAITICKRVWGCTHMIDTAQGPWPDGECRIPRPTVRACRRGTAVVPDAAEVRPAPRLSAYSMSPILRHPTCSLSIRPSPRANVASAALRGP